MWKYHSSPQALKNSRIKTINFFLQDYSQGKHDNRYLNQELPHLDFADRSFDLALCSHFLFLYSEHCDHNFHLASIKEMLRVSQEVRIFPLLTLMQKTSSYLDFVVTEFSNWGYSVAIKTVPYEFQPGGNKMLVIKPESW